MPISEKHSLSFALFYPHTWAMFCKMWIQSLGWSVHYRGINFIGILEENLLKVTLLLSFLFYLFLSSFHAVSTHGGCSAKLEWLMSFWDHVLYSALFFSFWWKRLAGSWMCCVSGHSVTALCSFSILPAFPPAGSQTLCWQDVYASVIPTLFITPFPKLPS